MSIGMVAEDSPKELMSTRAILSKCSTVSERDTAVLSPMVQIESIATSVKTPQSMSSLAS
jgi:hypothetical protein